MEQPPPHASMSQVEPAPHLEIPQPPALQVCIRQLAAAPSQEILHAPPHASMLQVPPALHVSMVQLPEVHAGMLQTGLSPVHCMEQLPLQVGIVQVAPVQGSEQEPDSVQSMLHSAPGSQVVWQLPARSPLQSTLHTDPAAHPVLQPPLGQLTAQAGKLEVQLKSQAPRETPAGKPQLQWLPSQEQFADGDVGFGAQVSPVDVPVSRLSTIVSLRPASLGPVPPLPVGPSLAPPPEPPVAAGASATPASPGPALPPVDGPPAPPNAPEPPVVTVRASNREPPAPPLASVPSTRVPA